MESLSHVVTLLDAYLNTFSLNWTLLRACEAGLSRRGLEYLAARDPNWGDGHDAAHKAVKKGFLHVLQWLNECYPDRTSWGSRTGRCLLNNAAEGGHLPVLQWLHANRREGCTAYAMSIAAAHGHLEMWLHGHRKEGCTEDAMDGAARNGHLEVVRFLHEKRREGCTSAALNMAAANGKLGVVQFLCANRTEGQAGTALLSAAENGRLQVAEWLHEIVRQKRRSESCIRKAARAAQEAGFSEVAELLEPKLKRQRLQ